MTRKALDAAGGPLLIPAMRRPTLVLKRKTRKSNGHPAGWRAPFHAHGPHRT